MSSDRVWRFRLEHILEAIEKIHAYSAGLSEPDFMANPMVVDAIIRNFQVIGEAARKIPSEIQMAHPEIPWSDMQKMRHVLVHDYDRVDVAAVWRTIHTDLTPLVPPLRALLVRYPR